MYCFIIASDRRCRWLLEANWNPFCNICSQSVHQALGDTQHNQTSCVDYWVFYFFPASSIGTPTKYIESSPRRLIIFCFSSLFIPHLFLLCMHGVVSISLLTWGYWGVKLISIHLYPAHSEYFHQLDHRGIELQGAIRDYYDHWRWQRLRDSDKIIRPVG